MTVPHIVGLVLAGGQARRLGGIDKPLLPLAGKPMLAWVLEALALPAVAISANGDPARFAGFGCPVLGDGAFGGHGPLAGVLAGLDWAAGTGAETLLTAPGDTPFLPVGLTRLLSPAPCAASNNGRRHHLVAAWPVNAREALRGTLTKPGSRGVGAFAQRIGMAYHDFDMAAFDPFTNVNTPADLDQARARLAGSSQAAAPPPAMDR